MLDPALAADVGDAGVAVQVRQWPHLRVQMLIGMAAHDRELRLPGIFAGDRRNRRLVVFVSQRRRGRRGRIVRQRWTLPGHPCDHAACRLAAGLGGGQGSPLPLDRREDRRLNPLRRVPARAEYAPRRDAPRARPAACPGRRKARADARCPAARQKPNSCRTDRT